MTDFGATLRIELFPADLDRAVAFYQALGFVVRREGPEYASLELGGVRLGLAEAGPVAPRLRAVPVGAEIVIEVDDVAGCRDAVLAADLEISEDLQERPWGFTDFRMFDPDGYYLRFTSRR